VRARLSVALHAVSVRRAKKWALKNISLDLKAGGHWALVGANGSGKTQLLKLIAGDVWPTPTGRERLVYELRGLPLFADEAKQRIAYLGSELQDKYARYGWNPSVRDLLATGLHRTDLKLAPTTAAERRKISATLSECGLAPLAGRGFSSLSYGQKRIALLARALCQAPDWLLLDEFYNGLDDRHRARIDDMLAAAGAKGCSWIAAAHRAVDVPRGTRGVIELEAGRLKGLRALGPAALARLKREAGENRARRRPVRRRLGAAAAGRAATGRAAAGLPATGLPATGQPLIRLRRVSLFVDYKRVLREVDWELRGGEHWAVFGENGAGKTSFLKLLYGDLSPALGGHIERTGHPRGAAIAEWKRRIGYVSPELQTDYASNVTVRDLVVSGRYASIGLADAPTAEDSSAADRWLRFFKLASFADRRPGELSYGQVRRALIARALAAGPRILLLDEPLTGLDPTQRAFFKGLLGRLMGPQLTLVVAVHHPEDLPDGMTRCLRLSGGRASEEDCHFAN
jgi:molybdate transport system ATP-binding protein